MIRKIVKELSPYEKYFLEAPRRNPARMTVTANPNDNRRTDFGRNVQDGDDRDIDSMELVDDSDDDDFSNNIEDDMMNMSDDEMNQADQDVPDSDVEPTVDGAGEADADNGLETEPPDGNEQPAPAEDGGDNDGGDAPADDTNADGDTEITANAEDDGGDDFADNIDGDDAGDESMDDNGGGDEGSNDAPADDGNGTEKKNTLDNQLKFSLYRNMMNLYLAIQNYQDKIDNLSINHFTSTLVSRRANDMLSDLEETLYQYMAIRFKDEDYTTSLLFYQKCKTAIELIFQMMLNNVNKDNTKDKFEL